MQVYGASVSYYTGKLETYLRYKGIAYEPVRSPYPVQAEITAALGIIQHPVVKCSDGRWMTDTTPIITHLEAEYPEPAILPADPVVAFCANLIEDYADEWLWRAAMHYRWSYDHDRELLSRILADEQTRHLKLPRILRRRMVKKRQLTGFVINDGVTSTTCAHVEDGYHRILTMMSTALQNRPFVLGHRPSLADIGLMGPMLRHFAQDPTPAEIMRDTAPDVFAWVARMWNAGAGDKTGALLTAMPDDLQPMLQEIAETHLVQLRANAAAWQAGQTTFAMQVQGCSYQDLPVSRYRVYCLEQLRSAFAELDAIAQTKVKELLPWPDATLLWQPDSFQSDYDPEGLAPFNKAINVFQDGVPS